MSASRYSALRISTRCCCPTERSLTSASGRPTRPNRSRELAHALLGAALVEQARRARLDAEDDVLGDGQRRHEHEVLVHHADAAAIASRAEANVDRLAVQRGSRPRPGGEPVEDVHQRRLAGAVLAEQRMDLAAADVEVDVVVGDDPRVALGDAAHLEDVSGAPATVVWRYSDRRQRLEGGPQERPLASGRSSRTTPGPSSAAS